VTVAYPAEPARRDVFVLERRGPHDAHDPARHQGWLVEDEPAGNGALVRVATIFLTGRECPWHCVMCDLWRHTLPVDTPAAVDDMRRDEAVFPSHVKLYNAGSFFDPRAVPEADYAAIAAMLLPFSHVIVESHPALIGPRVERLQRVLTHATLEVAMGLETAHPDALERLNKQMTLDDFRRAADALGARGVGLRAFVLVHPPFIPREEQPEWLARSVDAAFDCGASAVSLIPTRSGNGALDALSEARQFSQPRLADLERGFASALRGRRGRVFADLWDLGRFIDCDACGDVRHARLACMNRRQRLEPPVPCDRCGGSAS
jgi:archaeosine synthase beta-subunit